MPFPEPPKKKPVVSPDAQVNGADMSRLFDALAKGQEAQTALAPQRQQLQSDVMFGRHLGTGGGQITPDNPTGNLSNPWDKGGLFHGGFAAQMSPEALARSSGGTAVNQWNGLAGPNAAPKTSPVDAAVGASPHPFEVSPQSRSILGLPAKEPTLQDLGRPGSAVPQTGASFGFPQLNWTQQPQPQALPKPITPSQSPSGSPSSGFRFSM